MLARVSDPEKEAFRSRYGISTSARIGIFLGSLYPEKELGVLLAAARRIHLAHPDFILLIVGDGPQRGTVAQAARTDSFVRYTGRLDGIEKAVALGVAELMMLPGLVGLAILDAFAARVPLATRALSIHSPEIDYLSNGINGVMVDSLDSDSYADTVSSLLDDPGALHRLRAGCSASAEQYTVSAMVENFATGVLHAVEAIR
jgi:glycosyltransferase involved in cell wall biosynthesis